MNIFHTDIRRLSSEEVKSMAGLVQGGVLGLGRLLRLPVGRELVMSLRDNPAEAACSFEAVPERLRKPILPELQTLLDHGYTASFVVWDRERLGMLDEMELGLLSPDRLQLVMLRVGILETVVPHKVSCVYRAISWGADGRTRITASTAGEFSFRTRGDVAASPKATLASVLETHAKRVAEAGGGRPAPADPLAWWGAECRADFDEWTRRGVFVPVPEERRVAEIESWDRVDRTWDEAGLVAAHRRARLSGGRTSGWMLLVVTLIAFVVAGSMDFEPRTLALLTAAILLHEAGHWIAMKLCGYQDVRMFFIPFFGAAVSGIPNRPSPGKQVFVALAGPVPGLLLAAGLGLHSLLLGDREIGPFTLMLLALNGFNLLPFLPLDGGHAVRAAFTARFPLLDAAFQALAGVALILLGIGVSKGLLFLGVLTLLRCGLVYKLGSAAAELRRQRRAGLTPPPLAGSAESLREIARTVRGILPATQNPVGTPVGLMRELDEKVNVAPPGCLGTLFYSSLYAFSLLILLAGLAIACIPFFWSSGAFDENGMDLADIAAEVGRSQVEPEPLPEEALALAATTGMPTNLLQRLRGFGLEPAGALHPRTGDTNRVAGLVLRIGQEKAGPTAHFLRPEVEAAGWTIALGRRGILSKGPPAGRETLETGPEAEDPDTLADPISRFWLYQETLLVPGTNALEVVRLHGTGAGPGQQPDHAAVMATLTAWDARFGLYVREVQEHAVVVVYRREPEDMETAVTEYFKLRNPGETKQSLKEVLSVSARIGITQAFDLAWYDGEEDGDEPEEGEDELEVQAPATVPTPAPPAP